MVVTTLYYYEFYSNYMHTNEFTLYVFCYVLTKEMKQQNNSRIININS